MIAASGTLQQRTRVQTPSEDAAAIVVLRGLMFAALLGGLARTWADPDLWGHVRFGRDILRTGIPRTDPYSFTSDIPWVNHEWLAEVFMNLAWKAAGASGLVLLKMGLIAGALLLIGRLLARDGVHGAPRDLLIFATIAAMWARVFVVRPQIFSVALFTAVLWTLRSAERGRLSRLWLLPPIFALWVNLHGGWLVGLGVVATWAAAEVSPIRRSNIRWTVVAAAALFSAAATLINPYGLSMVTFLARSVGLNRPNINDWRPLWESGPTVILPWLLCATIAVVALARGWRSISAAHALIVVALGIGSVRVNRLDVFFALSVVGLLGRYISSTSRIEARPQWTRRVAAGAAIAVAMAIGGAWHFRSAVTCLRLDGPWMPEREAGQFIVQNQLSGRLLTWFDWGQYAIWHFDPQLRVSLDGRRETVYSDRFVAAHLQLYFEPGSQQELLRQLAPDYAWLPAATPLVSDLERQGWYRAFAGPISVVLARQRSVVIAVAPPTSPPCFPGP